MKIVDFYEEVGRMTEYAQHGGYDIDFSFSEENGKVDSIEKASVKGENAIFEFDAEGTLTPIVSFSRGAIEESLEGGSEEILVSFSISQELCFALMAIQGMIYEINFPEED